MITQYPWASVKQQERKYIEIGTMITLLVAIISFYSVPQFESTVSTERSYVAPPIDVIKIPATVQPPERIAPQRPTLPVESAKEDIADDLPVDFNIDIVEWTYFLPPPTQAPDIPLNPEDVSEMPYPVGGYQAILDRVIYPEIAREAGIEGMVTVKVIIGKDGLVRDAEILKGLPRTGLDEAALAAVLQSKFHPAMQMGRPVPVYMSIPIKFRLK